jgi:hypothetical protein
MADHKSVLYAAYKQLAAEAIADQKYDEYAKARLNELQKGITQVFLEINEMMLMDLRMKRNKGE